MASITNRRVLWLGIGSLLAVLAIVVAFRVIVKGSARRAAADGDVAPAGAPPEKKVLYHCPMHPTMVADRPGDCPICGMRMVPIEESDRPGKDSMGMDMVPVEVEDGEPRGARQVEGLAGVRIPVRKQQLIGVRTEEVKTIPFIRRIRTVGRVTSDETRLHHVHTKIEGWIEVLHVNATGVKVRKGQPLLAIHSPELVATQEEYLLALRARQAAQGETLPQIVRSGEELVESARRRLLFFDLSPAQIEELERTGVPSRTVTLHAPISGYVTQRNVTQGEKIDPDTTLLDITDLSRVWVIASVYEYELPFVHVGQTAMVTLSYLPGKTFRGRAALVYPVLEGTTRTAQVRLEFDNPDLLLKPEMYADVEIESDLGERLAVPESAVLSSGARNVVFVDQGEGYFEPRAVRIGARLSDVVEVLSGLSVGERVVASGTFFIDSESKLKAALEAAGSSGSKVEHQH